MANTQSSPKVNGKYVESTTSISTDSKADIDVIKSHENQRTNKVIVV